MARYLVALLLVLVPALRAQQVPELLRDAGHCLARYGVDPIGDAGSAHRAGYSYDAKTWPDDKYLVVVVYTDRNRSEGFVYGFSVERKPGQRILHLNNNGQFARSASGIRWVEELLGGIWTHDYFQRAIARIGSHPAFLLRPHELRAVMPSVVCTSYSDPAVK